MNYVLFKRWTRKMYPGNFIKLEDVAAAAVHRLHLRVKEIRNDREL